MLLNQKVLEYLVLLHSMIEVPNTILITSKRDPCGQQHLNLFRGIIILLKPFETQHFNLKPTSINQTPHSHSSTMEGYLCLGCTFLH